MSLKRIKTSKTYFEDENGKIQGTHETVNKESRVLTEYVDGTKTGPYKKWVKEKLVKECGYKHDNLHGILTEYRDGNVVYTGNWVMGCREGVHTWYHDNGEVDSTETHDGRGYCQGAAMSYYETGKLRTMLNYVNNDPVGWQIDVDENGSIVEAHYIDKDGMLQGEYIDSTDVGYRYAHYCNDTRILVQDESIVISEEDKIVIKLKYPNFQFIPYDLIAKL